MSDNFFQEVMKNITKVGNGQTFGDNGKGSPINKDISIFALNDSSQLDTMNEICNFLSKEEDYGLLSDEKSRIENELYSNLSYYDYGDFNILPTAEGNESWRLRGLS